MNCVHLDGSSSSSDGKSMIYHDRGHLVISETNFSLTLFESSNFFALTSQESTLEPLLRNNEVNLIELIHIWII